MLNAKSLDNVSVYINNELVQKTKLVTNYFGSGSAPVDKRLKLEKVQMLDPNTNASVGEYSFEYNTQELPERTSTLQDLWGFYRPGAQIFPVKTVEYYTGGYTFKYNSDSRLPTSATLASSLKKIIYPTGGYTNFNFENNTYYRPDPIYQTIIHTNATAGNTQQYAQEDTTRFTINQTTLFNYDAIVSPSRIFPNSNGTPLSPCTGWQQAGTALYKVGQSTPVRTFGQDENDVDWQLDAGTYYFQSIILEEDCDNAMVRVNLREKRVIGTGINYTAPGLRIGSMENYDPYSNKVQKTQYLYENDPGKSSGILFSTPKVVNQWTAYCENSGTPNMSKYFTSYFNDQSVTGGTIGPNVYYRQVSKKYVGANNGKVTNLYTMNALPFGSILSGNLFSMANTFRNGQLLMTTTFNEADEKVNSTTYEFSFLPAPSNFGFYAYKSVANFDAMNSDELSVTKYEIESGIKKINREIFTEYLDGGVITKTIDYTYNRPEQARPSSTTVTFNDGTKLVNNTKYATDYVIPTSGTLSPSLDGIKIMQEKRIYDIPLEAYQTSIDANNQAVVTEGTLMEVAPVPIAAPQKIYSLKMTDPLTNFSPSSVNGSSLSKDSRYTIDFEALAFQSDLPTSYIIKNELIKKIYFNPLYRLPASIATGVGPETVMLTSFEDNSSSPWTGSNYSYLVNNSVTGHYSAQLTGGSLSISGLSPTNPHMVSFYARPGASISVNGVLLTTGPNLGNQWKRFETVVTGVSTVEITGTGIIDELRLSTSSSRVQSYTYNSKRQLTSICDDKNQITRFEYDALGRLINVKDVDGNVLKTHEYQYQGAE